ncbi:hypothetical protein TNIN_83421 [Trichonephila inaurata madagascariensis]|uniref:Uncharacterized protein n=1 Tax=Trichonephila inaurata madagascariensis TaxID=2747483 RepID=A0A8X6YBH7_9ARAC|nr:hypothetical protein TNIN_83421 [Trichonephila inaurata madagascariensis]
MCLISNPNEENNKLDALMKFLRQEIEIEEKVRLARSGFNLELDNINKCTSASSRRERIPTAAELYNSSEKKKNLVYSAVNYILATIADILIIYRMMRKSGY